MKKILCFCVLFIFVVAYYGCKTPDGRWADNIKLSTRSVELSALSDSVTVTTGGGSWWVSNIAVNQVYYNPGNDFNIGAESYLIKHDCFVVERRDKHTLFIKVEANPLTIQRVITVELEAGDYFDRVTIVQKPRQ